MAYKHGVYGARTASQAKSAAQAEEVVLYVGTAPINLIRGYADKGLINEPVKVTSLTHAYNTVGYSEDWDNYSLGEVLDYHFNNSKHNIGPVYIINVLDPSVHKKASQSTKTVTFTAGKGSFASSTIILDTLAIAGKVEDVDYTLSYDMASGTVNIDSSKAETPMSGDVEVAFYEVNTIAISSTDIIGTANPDGSVTGLQAVKLLYRKYNAVCNIIAIPGFSEVPDVYKAMVAAAQKINGHWDAFVLADIPTSTTTVSYNTVTPEGTENPSEEGWYVVDGGEYVLTSDTTVQSGVTYYEKVTTTSGIDTIDKAKTWQAENGYTSELSKVFWPKAENAGKIYHLSTVCAAEMLYIDSENDAIPYVSASNHEIMATGQYFGEGVVNPGFDDQEANALNEVGITTMAYWEGAWKLWGGHTAAFKYNTAMDAAIIFDTNMRMLMHCTNGFQKRHGTEIDRPLTVAAKETIRISEQQQLDILKSIGALIGSPTCEFREDENSVNDMLNGDFVWNITATVTPQLKSATAKVTYTDEGFQALFGEEG